MTHDNVRKRSSLDKSIWWVLATVEGEPKSSADLNGSMIKNRYYWNGLMKPRVAEWADVIQPAIGRIELLDLLPEDHRKIRQALDTRGFNGSDIPNVNSTIDFSGVEFSKFTVFREFVFDGNAKFDYADFDSFTTVFASATFAGPVTFVSARFFGTADFQKTRFACSANFTKSGFSKAAVFSGSRFSSSADFSDARFTEDARFDTVKFSGNTDFVQSKFVQQAVFRSSGFTAPTYFQMARFENDVPSFFEASLFEYTDWRDTKWPKLPRGRDEARRHVQYYQRLVLLMNQLEKPHDLHFFFRKEMRAQRRSESILSLTRAMNLIYELVCDYGNGLGRIVSIWMAHILIGAATIWGTRWFTTSPDPGSKKGFIGVDSRFHSSYWDQFFERPCFVEFEPRLYRRYTGFLV